MIIVVVQTASSWLSQQIGLALGWHCSPDAIRVIEAVSTHRKPPCSLMEKHIITSKHVLKQFLHKFTSKKLSPSVTLQFGREQTKHSGCQLRPFQVCFFPILENMWDASIRIWITGWLFVHIFSLTSNWFPASLTLGLEHVIVAGSTVHLSLVAHKILKLKQHFNSLSFYANFTKLSTIIRQFYDLSLK